MFSYDQRSASLPETYVDTFGFEFRTQSKSSFLYQAFIPGSCGCQPCWEHADQVIAIHSGEVTHFVKKKLESGFVIEDKTGLERFCGAVDSGLQSVRHI